jgi:hypothetical protein
MGDAAELAIEATMAYPDMDPIDAYDAYICDLADAAEGREKPAPSKLFCIESYIKKIEEIKEQHPELYKYKKPEQEKEDE